ncbi:unnamed protein product [Auanema sp. JU1783]|nr:unnamed protein product [Auanema sp. JU1783]
MLQLTFGLTSGCMERRSVVSTKPMGHLVLPLKMHKSSSVHGKSCKTRSDSKRNSEIAQTDQSVQGEPQLQRELSKYKPS